MNNGTSQPLRETSRAQLQNSGAAQPARNPQSVILRSIADDVASAVDRLRRIEGERGLFNVLEAMLEGSRSVLVEHGVEPPTRESAEIESLRAQLDRATKAGQAAHSYATKYATALRSIADMQPHDLKNAGDFAQNALTSAVGQGESG